MRGWSALSEPWKASFAQAAHAYLHDGSVPIGAVVVSDGGEIVTRGRNGFAYGRLAHAEIAALSAISPAVDRSKCEIFCTLEPCPMCTGAIRLSQLRAVHCAADDPAAGSSAFLAANEFMREFPCSVHGPCDPELEFVVVTLIAEFRQRTRHDRWREQWQRSYPNAVAVGCSLASAGAHARWVSSSLSAEQLYEHVATLRMAA